LDNSAILKFDTRSVLGTSRLLHFNDFLLDYFTFAQGVDSLYESSKQMIVLNRGPHAHLSLLECLSLVLIEYEVFHDVLLSLDELALLLLGFEIELHEASPDLFIDKHFVERCQASLIAKLESTNRIQEP